MIRFSIVAQWERTISVGRGLNPTMTRAVFDGVVIAESDNVKVVEGMTYFPAESVDGERFQRSIPRWSSKQRRDRVPQSPLVSIA